MEILKRICFWMVDGGRGGVVGVVGVGGVVGGGLWIACFIFFLVVIR